MGIMQFRSGRNEQRIAEVDLERAYAIDSLESAIMTAKRNGLSPWASSYIEELQGSILIYDGTQQVLDNPERSQLSDYEIAHCLVWLQQWPDDNTHEVDVMKIFVTEDRAVYSAISTNQGFVEADFDFGSKVECATDDIMAIASYLETADTFV